MRIKTKYNNIEQSIPEEVEEKEIDKKEIKKITSANPVKKNIVQRLIRTFIGEVKFSDALANARRDIVIPTLKNILSDASKSVIDSMIYGSGVPPYRSNNTNRKVSYGGYYSSNNPKPIPQITGGKGHVEKYYIENRNDAIYVLNELKNYIDIYGIVTIADYYEMIGVETKTHHHNWGWGIFDLEGVTISSNSGGWVINLPRAKDISTL